MVYIYTLSDSSGVRYVGKTNNINLRLKNHINESKKNNRCYNYRTNWIISLINKDELPIIEVLDIVPDDEWMFWEIFWISQIKSWGFNLVNGTLGGENPPSFAGKTHSNQYKEIRRKEIIKNNPTKNMNNDWKLKISESNKNRKLSKEHIRKLGKPVIQLTLENEFIKKWESSSVAGRSLKISINNISACCRGDRKNVEDFDGKERN